MILKALITYEDKVAMNENADIPAINKCQASDMNEIKSVVNQNYDNFLTQSVTIRATEEESFGSGLNYYYLSKINDIYSRCGDLFKEIATTTVSGSATSMTGLKIPVGVKKINVSAQAMFTNDNTSAAMYFSLFIYKISANGEATELARGLSQSVPITNLNNVTINCSEVKGVEVAEGDIIGLRVYKSNAQGTMTIGAEARTYISIEKAE